MTDTGRRTKTGRTAVAVVGGGPSGLVSALALASAGVATTLFAPPSRRRDRRTTALLHGSVRILDALGLWVRLRPHAAPLVRLRIIDATSRLVRAPETIFDSSELGLDAFGYNVPNQVLQDELLAATAAHDGLRVLPYEVERIELGERVNLYGGDTVTDAQVIFAADGRDSVCRAGAGIELTIERLPQTALACNLRHARSHHGISTEFHTESGPFTLVPLQGDRSSVVCVVTPEEAEALAALDDAALSLEMERRAHSILGRMEIEGERGVFPLTSAIASRFAASRILLVGEAGHVLPPIGAQGLNLGIRDAATAAELIADAHRAGRDLGGEQVLLEYDRRRRADVRARARAVAWMNHSLLTGFLPVHLLRGIGFELASRFAPFRRALMREGLGPREEDAPRLARGEAL